MRTKNVASLIGIVGKDAELRKTSQNVEVARFSLATSTGGYKKQDGTEVPEVTQWHSITCWRSLAEFAGKYVRKGMKVAVDGQIIYGKFTGNDGRDVNTVEIMANDIVLMTNPNAGQGQQAQAGQQAPQPQPQQQSPTPQPNNGGQQYAYQPPYAPQQGYTPPQAQAQAPVQQPQDYGNGGADALPF